VSRKTKLDRVVACCCVAVATFPACPLAFSQTAPASSAESQKACEPMPPAWEKLTPSQKSLLERTYNATPLFATRGPVRNLVFLYAEAWSSLATNPHSSEIVAQGVALERRKNLAPRDRQPGRSSGRQMTHDRRPG